MIKPLAVLAVFSWCAGHPAQASSIQLDFASLAFPVTGHLNLELDDVVVTHDVALDGSQHRHFTGFTSFIDSPWTLTNDFGHGTTLTGLSAPGMTFQLDSWLHLDGSSRLMIATDETVIYGHSGQGFSGLSFTMTCGCNALYTPTITLNTFSKFQTLEGQAFVTDRRYYGDYPDGSWYVVVDKHTAEFSSGGRSVVPEPSTTALTLAGFIAAGRWGKTRGFKSVTTARHAC